MATKEVEAELQIGFGKLRLKILRTSSDAILEKRQQFDEAQVNKDSSNSVPPKNATPASNGAVSSAATPPSNEGKKNENLGPTAPSKGSNEKATLKEEESHSQTATSPPDLSASSPDVGGEERPQTADRNQELRDDSQPTSSLPEGAGNASDTSSVSEKLSEGQSLRSNDCKLPDTSSLSEKLSGDLSLQSNDCKPPLSLTLQTAALDVREGNPEESQGGKRQGGVRDAQQDGLELGEKKPQPLRFRNLGLEVPDLGEGCDEEGQVATYEAAVCQFNDGMTAYKKALSYFMLDGFVTIHFKINMDISALHRHLAVFEAVPSRACQLHKRRAARLEPLVTALNPKAFPAIWKQLLFELGSIYRQAMELELLTGRGLAKAAPLGQQSVTHYEQFLAAFENGSVPEEDRYHYLMSHFYLGTVYYTLQPKASEVPSGNVAMMARSLKHFKAMLALSDSLSVAGLEEHLSICREMAEVLPGSMNVEIARWRTAQKLAGK
eukprot:TRINITY_DN15372_c0_g3_i1.p1 TRINITY_DN15372_c0_g3~~TRINITY_DN15372_c0_g3_i1.p1  ORF type:complete len:494 (-),score=90.05 TRINITY_DN15372_c0_g3_i1:102-1583(-)